MIVFLLAYGLHYFAYFLRARYYTWVGELLISEGLAHVMLYLGHLYFVVAMLIYAWAVKKGQKIYSRFSG